MSSLIPASTSRDAYDQAIGRSCKMPIRLPSAALRWDLRVALGALHSLNNRRYALADADTHGCQAVTTFASFKFVEQGDDNAGSTTAERVPQGDCPAVDVEPFLVDSQLTHALQSLDRKGFVQFDQVHILHS